MLYLLNKDVRTVRWNGEPLHEATSTIVKETMNGDFTLTVKYPISDSGIYQLIQEDMLIKAPIPVLGAQLFRIKKPVEHNDHLEITAYHISDDVMQRSITPMSVTSQSCGMALSRMVQNTKTALGDFSFNSDIQDRRTFNTTETETLYSVLLDGKHSIVGTWEGELVRDNFAMTVKKSRGENRGVVITTHKNLKDYQRTKNSQNVVTRIHAKSTFKPEGAEKETTIRVTVDSPLINSYPYINEKEYENNNAKSVEELQKWAQAKFSNEGIDKISDAIKIEAYELDGQVVHMGDTVNLKSWKHNVDVFKKAIAYEFDALKEEYISLTFDDKAGAGGSRTSGGLSSAADAILGVTESAQEVALEKALQNADLDFDHKAGLLRQEISDGIELAKAKAEEVKQELSDTINQRFNSFDNGPLKETKRKAEEALRNAGASTLLAQEAKRIGLDSVARLEAFKSQTTSAQTALSGDLDALKQTVTSEVNQASEYRRTTTEVLSRMTGQMDGFATKSEVRQDVAGLTETFAKLKTDTNNLISGAKSEITLAKTEFQKTADGLSAKMSAVERYVNQDGQRQESLQRYARDESARQVSAVREQISRDYVGKSAYQEDVRGLERRFSAISTQTNNDIARKIAQYKQTVDGQFASITSQIAGKANQTDFQRVKETSKLYERILGNSKNGIANTIARMAMTHQLFQVEVSKNDHLKTVQRQLAGSWSVQNINSAGDLISGINLGANGHNRLSGKLTHITGETLIDRAVIKSAMVDKLKTGNFEAGSVTTTILAAEAVTAEKVRFDDAFIRKMIANDAFIDQLTSKRIFSTKVESVISSSTFLEAYQGRIGGFTIGRFAQGRGRWISGINQFSVGMGNGEGGGYNGENTAFWANWGYSWNSPGPNAWYVTTSGNMYCRNGADFHGKVDFSNSSRANFYGNTTFSRSPVFSNGIELGSKDVFGDGWNPKGGRNAVVWWNQVGSGSVKYWMEQKSDRRLKENITDTAVKALDKINRLRMVAFDFIESKKHEEIGLIAQEAETIVPRIVSRDPENPDGYLHIDYTALVPYLIKAIQELNQKIEKMEKTIA
ncbi:bacteriophage PblB [Streptococcus pneumoniae]|nr:bacteriophage PblB [Streptococcus pneumoniae]COJ80876.1 bacteriophage PblB [Streptococcus pneumoniae]VKI02090.1 bacteriophage PblB [Streptococcus pneumoniae]VNL27657.1 bacteriophage PblB [Streptococcus pneumoniae]